MNQKLMPILVLILLMGACSKDIGFDITGQCASKSSLTSSWHNEDLDHTFGANLVDVVWNGSKYIGFDSVGQIQSKATLTSSWRDEGLSHVFQSKLVCATFR